MTTPEHQQRAETLAREKLSQMTLAEKLALMSGATPFWGGLADMLSGGYHRRTWDAGKVERLGVEGVRFSDGPRGVVIGSGTTFPVSMARGACWDTDLERRIGEAMGQEARAVGANLFGGVCINLLRHPAWGRAQETYGEDSHLLGELGAALTEGAQRHVMACVKHFALNSMENARFSLDVSASPRALHEVYLPHFRRVVEAGVACVMSAYNSVNGEWAGESGALLDGVLKTRWGFRGYVVTDWIFGLRDAGRAVLGGQDLEMPFLMHFARDLLQLVEAGEVPISRIDDSALRIVRMQLEFARPDAVNADVLACKAHTDLAREAAQKSVVLLRNIGPLLPLNREVRLAVLGHLAATANTGDGGSSNTVPPYVVTPLQGLQTAFQHVVYDSGLDLAKAGQLAAEAEAVLVVVGYTRDDEGEFVSPDTTSGLRALFPVPTTPEEQQTAAAVASGLAERARESGAFSRGGDRASLRLSPADEALILAAAGANNHVVVAVMAGSAVLMNAWQDAVSSILMLWYPGMEGGHALADVLLGVVNPGGRLPFSVASDERHYPHFDRDAATVTYDLWHGYRKLERDHHPAAYPFGFGLSYTTFSCHGLQLQARHDGVDATLDVENTGERDGEMVVQLYVSALLSRVERPVKELRAFARVALRAGQKRPVTLSVPVSSLAYFCESEDDFVLEPLEYEFIAAQHSADASAPKARIWLGQPS